MSIEWKCARTFGALVAALILVPMAMAQPVATPYQNAAAMLDRIAGSEAPISIRVVIEALVIGDGNGSLDGGVDRGVDGQKVSKTLVEGEEGLIAEALKAHIPATSTSATSTSATSPAAPSATSTSATPAPSPPLFEVQPFPDLPGSGAPGDPAEGAALVGDDTKLLAARADATFVLIVRIVDYHSGRYDLYETRAGLYSPASKQRLALDIGWTSRIDGTVAALFINGSRLK